MDESMEEEPFPEKEGASVEGRSQDDENGTVLEDNIGDVDTEEEEEGAVTVLKLPNGVMFRVPVEVQDMQLQAVVDTAAQVTRVSEEFYKSLDPAPPIRREVVMNTAGKGMQMNGYIAGPFQVVLGTHQFSVEIYLAPIEEEMLLGLDFLEANGVSLHLKEKKLEIAGEVIHMSLGAGSPLVNEKETGVSLVKGCKVPPNSVMRVGAQLSETMGGEYIVKAATKGEILIPRTMHKGGDNPVLCLINLSDHHVELEKCWPMQKRCVLRWSPLEYKK
jgi:predicted aspartyl protease